MSPHSSQVDVEEVQRVSLLSNPDAQVDGSIDLSDCSGDGNPASSSLIVRGDDDVEAVQTTPAQPSFDAQLDGDIELAPLASLTETRHLERSISREKFHVKIWTYVINWFYDWWMGELLSMLLSVVAFCSLVAVLLKYDGQTLPTLPHNVSLNFLVSTLATVSKSSLLLVVASALGQFKWLWMMSSKQPRLQDLQDFDEASRGPLGAVQLLTSRNGLSWASIGSFITILCLIFDPFVQVLIVISTQVIYKNDSASLLHKIDYFPDNLLLEDYVLIHNINTAAFNPSPQSETMPYCSTGNCTWPVFTSLGYCSKCEDISRSLQDSTTSEVNYYNCGSDIDNWVPSKKDDSDCQAVIGNYTYTFPTFNGQDLKIADVVHPSNKTSFNVRFEMSSIYERPSFLVLPLEWQPDVPFNFTDGTSIFGGGLISFVRLSAHAPSIGDILTADVCALSLCAQKRNVSISFNQLSSIILQTVWGKWIHLESDSEYFYYPDAMSFVKDDINKTFPPVIPKYPNGEGHQLLGSQVSFLEAMLRTFQDEISLDTSGTLAEVPGKPRELDISFKIISAFNASSNISVTMENIAITLTNFVRDSSNLTVVGQVGHPQVFVNVIWIWLVLPTFIVMASIVFLTLAMYETKRQGACVWRTSEIALLFHGRKIFDEELQALQQVSEMEQVASKIRVKMTKISTGEWLLHRETGD